jgi:glycosyltransferase involved in cell wall biosynthesis
MNIWFFSPVLDRYGASNTVLDIALFAAKEGMNVTLFVPTGYIDASLLIEIESKNQIQVKILDIPILRRGIIYSLKSLALFILTFRSRMRLLKSELDMLPRPDVIHFATLATVAISGISYPGLVKNLSVHEITRNRFEKKILQKICKRNIDVMSFCSSNVRANFGNLTGQVIYSGVDISKFSSSPELSTTPSKVARIACVGRLNSWKGQDLLLESLSILKGAGLEFSCDFYGSTLSGEEFHLTRLLELTGAHQLSKDVNFLGEVANIHECLRNYEILVVPSIIPEPFGKIVVEGMSAKCLLIASNEGGPLEVISHLYSGLLFEARNPRSLAKSISWALENPDQMRQLRLNGFSERLKYSNESTSKQYLELWRSLLNSR